MLSSCQLMSAHVSSPAATAPWPADVSPRNSWHLCNILSWFLDTRYTSDLPWSKAHSELNQPMSENILRECRKRCPSPCSFAGHLFRCLRFEGCKPWWTNANFMHFKNLSVCHWLSNFDISVLFHSSFLHAWRHTAAPCELYWTGFFSDTWGMLRWAAGAHPCCRLKLRIRCNFNTKVCNRLHLQYYVKATKGQL